MKENAWSISFEQTNHKDTDFPKLLYKGRVLNIEEQILAINSLYDKINTKIPKSYTESSNELPFKNISKLIFVNVPEYEFQYEYLAVLLNFFKIEF